LDVIDISAEGLAAYVVPECRTWRPQERFGGRSTALWMASDQAGAV